MNVFHSLGETRLFFNKVKESDWLVEQFFTPVLDGTNVLTQQSQYRKFLSS